MESTVLRRSVVEIEVHKVGRKLVQGCDSVGAGNNQWKVRYFAIMLNVEHLQYRYSFFMHKYNTTVTSIDSNI